MPTVSEAGIAKCLKLWKLGNMLKVSEDEMFFTMNTNKLEFVFLLRNKDENIYCGASVTVSCDKGLFGGRQYFRIRNYQDNSEPYCGFYSFLGEDVIIPDVDSSNFHTGSCSIKDQGIFWSVKSYSEDVIILQGCGDDEYTYCRNLIMNERFESTE